MIDTGLQGKVVLITGANNPHGIGAAAARAFAAQGAQVFISWMRLSPLAWGVSEEEAQSATLPGDPFYHRMRMLDGRQVIEEIRATGGTAQGIECDLSDPRNIPGLLDEVQRQLGPVDVLVNNAAHYEQADTLFDASAEGWDRTFEINVRAGVLLAAEFVRRCKARNAGWGRVINLSTDAAQFFAGQIHYGASKAAMEAYTRSLAIESAPLGITVNCIAPGPVQTGYINAKFEEQIVQVIPLGRLGTPRDIADAIVFLASAQADWITGLVLKVSGGHNI